MDRLTLQDPLWLLALLALPLVVWLRGRRRVPVLLVPFAAAWHRPSLASPGRWPAALVLGGLALLVVALARPQRVEDRREVRSEGYDIVLAIDLSTSMRAEDFEKDGERINRLQAIKPVIQAFIERRPTDRIGIVLFSGRAYTMAPLTFDHDWLARQLARVRIGMIEDGTAIGDGLGVALTRLEQARRDAAGRRIGAFVVLMTDGANNRGALQPLQAAEIAKSRGVPIYTIGSGKEGYVPVPIYDDQGRKVTYRRMLSDLDEGTLREIANQTGGKFFRAADTGTIEAAFRAIDRAQKIEFQAKSYLVTTELFAWAAWPGLGLLALGAAAARPPFRREVAAGPSPSPTSSGCWRFRCSCWSSTGVPARPRAWPARASGARRRARAGCASRRRTLRRRPAADRGGGSPPGSRSPSSPWPARNGASLRNPSSTRRARSSSRSTSRARCSPRT
ncbi:MAG: VWA domain-containing protein [Opitutaceae bacterium]